MVAVETLGALVVASAGSLFMAWSIGAGSSGSTPFAPAVGANAISILRAGFFVGLLGLAGATLQGANVTETVGRNLIGGVTLTPTAATLGLFIAAFLVAFGVFVGYPIATAFTVTGAMVGVGLALGGTPAWAKYQEIAALWILTPVIGGGTAFAIAWLLDHDAVPEVFAIPTLAAIVGGLVANIEFSALSGQGGSASIAGAVARAVASQTALAPTTLQLLVTLGLAVLTFAVLFREVSLHPAAGQRRFLLALGALVAFSAGGSQVGLALGPLVPVLSTAPIEIPLGPVLFVGGLGLLIGSWTGAPRMIKALSQDYSSLGPQRSIAALIPSFAIAQIAVFFGIPVSFNEIIVSAIVGSGYASGVGNVSRKKMAYTVLAWIGSLVLALGVSYGGYSLVDWIL